MANIDQQEIKKFSDIAEEWWNKDGDFKPLHVINPLRAVSYTHLTLPTTVRV